MVKLVKCLRVASRRSVRRTPPHKLNLRKQLSLSTLSHIILKSESVLTVIQKSTIARSATFTSTDSLVSVSI